MKTAAIGALTVLGFLLVPAFIYADPPAPATLPVHVPIPKDETPKDAVLRGTKVFDLFDVDAAMEMYDYSGEAEAKLCRLQCEYDIAIAHLEKPVNEKWGKEGDDGIVHALGEETDDDVRQAHVTIEGDHAVVHYKADFAPAFPMVRVKGVWKFAWHEIYGSMSPADVKNLAAALTAMRDGIPKIADDLKAGKLRSADAVIAMAKELTAEAFN